MKQFIALCKKEAVLSVAVVLAFCSMIFVRPDKEYLSYLDLRTLGILFCLMTIVAGLQQIGIFDRMAQALLARVHGISGIVTILVLLCFFCSMLITNDVALITFVPLAIILMKRLPEPVRAPWMIRCIVMQTIAANLGSMLTPIGNPQNLYLYGKAEMGIGSFFRLMLPYSAASLVLLILWIWVPLTGRKAKEISMRQTAETQQKRTASEVDGMQPIKTEASKKLWMWVILFGVSLLSVARILPWKVPFVLVLVYGLLWNREVLRRVDYSLLGTFTALFIFIGNLGRIPEFSHFLQNIMDGREVLTSVLASQVMSNVPAAILLSGFTGRYSALIVGTNLGGLGTLIASMASLISFKYVAREDGALKGRYLIRFTAANLLFLAVLLLVWQISGGML